MTLTAIAAMDCNGLIGDGMKMPWHLPRDLRRFRDLTMGKPVIMGRRTLESLRGPLKGRLNIVLSRAVSYRAKGCIICGSIEEAMKAAEDHGDEAMVIGGGVIFDETSESWNKILLTVVQGKFSGDTFFPINKLKSTRWELNRKDFFKADEKNPHSHWYLELQRSGTNLGADQDFDLSCFGDYAVGEEGIETNHRKV